MRLLGFAVLASTIAVTTIALSAPPAPDLDSHRPRALDTEATFQAQAFTQATAVAYLEADRIFRSLQEAAVLDVAYRHQQAVRAAALARRAKSSRPTGRWAIPAHIVMCESGGDYRAENPTSSASGAYQITRGTWGGYKGYENASDAPPSVQDERAAQIWDAGRGRHNWVC